MNVKPIETKYKGYRFRSRLEARTAVFLDAAGIPYEYETEGFSFEDGTAYLPDFYLPELNCFVECKGMLNGNDGHKILLLAKTFRTSVIVVYPNMKLGMAKWVPDVHDYYPQDPSKPGVVYLDCNVYECVQCGKKFFDEPNGTHICPYGCETATEVYDGDTATSLDGFDAIDKAKSARFEFGEEGAEDA